MKKIAFLILICVCIGNQSFGQKKKIQLNPSYDKKFFHLGFTLGFNSLDYSLLHSSSFLGGDSVFHIEPQNTVGINLGIVSDLRMGKYMNLRCLPGMLFGQRNLVYTVRDLTTPKDEFVFIEKDPLRISSIYLDLPISIKFRGDRINNYRPYVIAGMAFKYDLETKRVGRDKNDIPMIKRDPAEYFYEIGFGVDWYLIYFKLSTEFKYSFGLNNILIQEPNEFSNSIESLRSKMFILSLHFE